MSEDLAKKLSLLWTTWRRNPRYSGAESLIFCFDFSLKTLRRDHWIILSTEYLKEFVCMEGGILWALAPVRESSHLWEQWYILICAVESIRSSRWSSCKEELLVRASSLSPSPWHLAVTGREKKTSAYTFVPECHFCQKALIRPFIQVLAWS